MHPSRRSAPPPSVEAARKAPTSRCGAFLAFFAAALWHPALAADRLDEPAIKTERAMGTPVLDLVRTDGRLIALGKRGHILYSDDGGSLWRQADVPVRVALTGAAFASPEIGYAVGHDTVILRTDDGGRTWVSVLDGRRANEVRKRDLSAFVTRLEQDVATLPSETPEREAAERRLEDKRFLLEEIERDLSIGPHKALFSVAVLDQEVAVAAGANGLVLATRDGGRTWEDWSARLDNGGLYHLYAVERLGGDALMIAGEGGLVFRSLDRGATWARIASPTEVSMFDLAAGPLGDAAYLVGMAGEIYETSDLGENWRRVKSGTESILQAGSVGADGTVFVGGLEGVVLRKKPSETEFARLQIPAFSANTKVVGRRTGGAVIAGLGGVAVIDETMARAPTGYIRD